MNSAFYYLMKERLILRLEEPLDFDKAPKLIIQNLLDPQDENALNQEQANYRVAIFRDEIVEFDEFRERTAPREHQLS